ncbi:MAG: acyl-CoA dehydrogenase [Bacteroidetes bacterium SW_9_63_38]|nr:MAG: acyl-CoA dehydrogenase [Bacteroidetes bacterium SW_9_63_38]
MASDFVQDPPELENQYDRDRVLQSYIRRQFPESVLKTIEPELVDLGEKAGGELYDLQQSDLDNEPTLAQWSPWGERIDEIEVTDVWKRAETLAAERGIVATAYEQEHGAHSRVHQMLLAYLFIPSTDMYGCPLAMTDGAVRTLLKSDNEALADEAVPHLTSRDPDTFWTSGQWMTELTGGSDVGQSQTTARQDDDGTWRLYGRRWFTSAITADMALALARPEGNPEGGKGLALFYVPIRDGDALRDGLHVNRLKDKLGTRKLPTAELELDGAAAHPVGELQNGTRQISPMLNVTRMWNSVTAVALIRRGMALARDYAQKRQAFGDDIINHPLHQETLADVQAIQEGNFHLALRLAELMGARETGEANTKQNALFHILTPLIKLTTAKESVAATSELLEAFGGAGYVEDTGLPALHRDAQVLPIWEGTTNVLALELLRALRSVGSIAPLNDEVKRCVKAIEAPTLNEAIRPAVRAYRDAVKWLKGALNEGKDALEAGARRFALTLGKSLEVLLTARHAQWSLRTEQDGRSAAAAERLAARKINHIADLDSHGSYVLVWDFNCPTLFDCHAQGDGATADEPEIGSLTDVM